jgi:parvulin-like peptidyl-prolyl isomerase
MQFRITNKNALSKEEKFLLKVKGLNRIIRNNLLLTEASSSGVFLTRNEYEVAFSEIESEYKEDSFLEYLKIQNISYELWKRRFKNNLLINKFINIKFKIKTSGNKIDAKKYYEAHKDRFKKGRMVQASHIMVATEEEAKVVYDAIKSRKKSFLELAKIYSLAPEISVGGDLEYFEVDQMPEEFNAISKLKIDQISDMIKTPYGYYIFKIVDIKAPKQLSFLESQNAIYDQFSRNEQSSTFKKWLVELKNNSNIKIYENVLSKISL